MYNAAPGRTSAHRQQVSTTHTSLPLAVNIVLMAVIEIKCFVVLKPYRSKDMDMYITYTRAQASAGQ